LVFADHPGADLADIGEAEDIAQKPSTKRIVAGEPGVAAARNSANSACPIRK
jgi:hypothetical protein